MGITAKQLERRKTQPYTSGSDLAAVCGCDPFRSAYDVWLVRRGMVDDARLEVAHAHNRAMQMGTMLEPVILDWASQRLGKLLRNQRRVNRPAMLACHLDAITGRTEGRDDPGDTVEAKSSGMTWALSEQWGDTDDDYPTDEIPMRIVPQAYAGMICNGSRRCWVPTILGGRGFRMYLVEYRKSVADELVRRNLAFIGGHVETRIPPEDCKPSMEFVRALRRQPEQVREIPVEMVSAWRDVKRKRLELEKAEDEAKRDIWLELEGCDGGTIDGELVVTNKMQTRKAYTVAESSFAVLREVKRPTGCGFVS